MSSLLPFPSPSLIIFVHFFYFLTQYRISLLKNFLTRLIASMSSSSCSSPSEFLQALKRASDANSLLDTQKLLQTWRSSQSLRNPTVVELTTVLAHASERNRPNIVRFLLQEGAEIWSKLVADLAGKDVSTDIWDVFVEMGFNVKSIAESRSSPAEPPLK